MGKVEEFVKEKEREKHLDTEDYISLLHWYITECSKIDQAFIEATKDFISNKADLNNEFNAKLREGALK